MRSAFSSVWEIFWQIFFLFHFLFSLLLWLHICQTAWYSPTGHWGQFFFPVCFSLDLSKVYQSFIVLHQSSINTVQWICYFRYFIFFSFMISLWFSVTVFHISPENSLSSLFLKHSWQLLKNSYLLFSIPTLSVVRFYLLVFLLLTDHISLFFSQVY